MNSNKRPNVDKYFSKMAKLVSTRSTCTRRQVGAVLVREKQVVSTGYNGSPRNMPHCTDIGCLRDELGIESGTKLEVCRAVHAEQNAIIQCAVHGKSTRNSTLYVTISPCKICARMVTNAEIVRVVVSGYYHDTEGINLLKEAGIIVDYCNLE